MSSVITLRDQDTFAFQHDFPKGTLDEVLYLLIPLLNDFTNGSDGFCFAMRHIVDLYGQPLNLLWDALSPDFVQAVRKVLSATRRKCSYMWSTSSDRTRVSANVVMKFVSPLQRGMIWM